MAIPRLNEPITNFGPQPPQADSQPGKPKFYECGICGHLHPASWDGDCRDDNNRFTFEQVEQRYGKQKADVGDGEDYGWEEVKQPS